MNYKKAKNMSIEDYENLTSDDLSKLMDAQRNKDIGFQKYVDSTIFDNLNPIDIEYLKSLIVNLMHLVEADDDLMSEDEEIAHDDDKFESIDKIEDFLSTHFKLHFYFTDTMILNGNDVDHAPKCTYLAQSYPISDLYKKL